MLWPLKLSSGGGNGKGLMGVFLKAIRDANQGVAIKPVLLM
jgi:hypothetical protein